MKKNRCVGFVPARSGSKRLVGKNLRRLGGRSLVERALDSAVNSRCFDSVVLSTDSEEIAASGSLIEGVEVDLRDPVLASDTATVLQTVLEYVERRPLEIDAIAVMLPTCPFRRSQDIRQGFDLFAEGVDFVVSVVEYNFPWEMALDIDGQGWARPSVQPSPLVLGNTRSQDRRQVFHPNGAFYLGRIDALIRHRTFFGPNLKCVPMTEYQSWDVDEESDLVVADFLLEAGLVNE